MRSTVARRAVGRTGAWDKPLKPEWESWLPVIAAVGLSVVGAINAPEVQRLVPLDLTLGSMGLASLCICIAFTRGPTRKGAVAGLAFALTWVPAALMPHMNTFGSEKTTQLFTVGLLALILGSQFGHLDSFLRRFAGASITVGVLLAGVLLAFGNTAQQGRLAIFDLNPIGLGRITGMAALLLLLSLPGRPASRKATILPLALFCAYITYQTQSMGPFGAIWVAAAVAMFLKKERRSSAVIFGLGAGMMALVASGAIASRINQSAASDKSSLDRFELYEASWQIFTQHLGGIGWGNLYAYLPESARVSALGIEQHSHNIVMEVAVEGGIVALIGLVAAAGMGLIGLLAHGAASGDQRPMGMWLYAIAIAMTSGNLPGNRVTLVMLGVGLALYVARQRNSQPVEGVPEPIRSVVPTRKVARGRGRRRW